MSLLASAPDRRQPHSSTPPNIPGYGTGVINERGNVAVVPDELAEPLRDLAVPTRRARWPFTGQFAPGPWLAVLKEEFGIVARKAGSRPPAAMPQGVFEVNDERRNINVPPAVAYGSIVQLTPRSQEVVF